ncbi:MAG: protein translocase SEC61 complex subunit gamma [Nanoarchaeota archaeon]
MTNAFLNNLKEFTKKCIRVWHVLKKPTRKEFEMIAKVSAVGIAIIGALGFLVSILVSFFVK